MTSEHPSLTTWRDDFVLAMRLRDADGRAIGDALAEIEEFCRDTGQDVEDAFGPAQDYAERLTAHPATWRVPWRVSWTTLTGLAGMMLLLWAVTADGGTLDVTLGQLLGVACVWVGAVLVVRVAAPGRHSFVVLWLAVVAVLGAVVAVGVLVTSPVLALPVAVAVSAGVVLLLGAATWETWRALRAPTADVVTSPWEDPARARRRNLRWSVASAWLLPAMSAVGLGLLTVLERLLDGTA